jgi:hypothetical protein
VARKIEIDIDIEISTTDGVAAVEMNPKGQAATKWRLPPSRITE